MSSYFSHTIFLNSFFGDFFGFGGGQQQGERETPKGDSITIPLEVTLEEIYQGNFVEVCCVLHIITLYNNIYYKFYTFFAIFT